MTGVPADAIRELAHTYGAAQNAQLCWTLGITEHHNAVDNVFALINLALLTGKVGKWGSGLQPLRGQNNVQGGGDMGAIPNRLPGFQELLDDEHPREVRLGVGRVDSRGARAPPDRDVRGDGARRAARRLRRRREPGAGRGRPAARRAAADAASTTSSSRTSSSRARRELADVVLPAAATLGEVEGTVTSSERRVQRVRKAYDPPGEARDDIEIVYELGRRLGHDLGSPRPRTSGTSCARSRRCTPA